MITSSCSVCPGGQPSGVEAPLRDVEMGEQAAATWDLPWPLKRLRGQAAMPPLVPSDDTTVAELDKWKEDLNAAHGLGEVRRRPICSIFCLESEHVSEPE